jgi:hypothetical protein
MRILVKANKLISDEIKQRQEILASGLRDGVHRTGEVLQAELRSQVRRANLGEGLEKAWRLEKFPKRRSKLNLDPAAVVYSKSTILHRAFDESRTIRASRKQYVVIALPAAIHLGLGYSRKSRKGGTVPAGALRKVSDIDEAAKKLRAVVVSATHGKRGPRVAKAKPKGRNAPIEGRRIVIMKAKKGEGLTAVFVAPDQKKPLPLFALRRQVVGRKLLDIAGPAQAAKQAVKREVNAAIAGRLA